MQAIRSDSVYSWGVAIATLVLASVSFGAANSLPILFPEISGEFAWNARTVGSLYVATMGGAAISSVLMGRLLDRIGFFWIGMVAGVLLCAGLALASAANTLWHFYIIYMLLIGVGQGAFLSTVAAAVSQWFSRHRSLAIAIALCGQGTGGLLVPPLLRALTVAHGWRDALLSYAIFACVMMVLAMLLYLPRPPLGASKTVMAQQRARPRMHAKVEEKATRGHAVPGNALILWLASGLLLANSASMGVASHLVAYGTQAGLAPVAAGVLMSTHWGLVLAARLLVGYFLDRMNKYRVLRVATIVQVVGTILICLADSVPLVALGAACVGIGFGGYYPAYGAIVQGSYPKWQVGRRMTELYLASFIAAGFGTWFNGVLFDVGGNFQLAFLASFFLSLASLGVVILCKTRVSPSRSAVGRAE